MPTFLTVVSCQLDFLVLLGVNTLLAQDAFTLSNLKDMKQRQLADQRDASIAQIDSYAAPENLAAAAAAAWNAPI